MGIEHQPLRLTVRALRDQQTHELEIIEDLSSNLSGTTEFYPQPLCWAIYAPGPFSGLDYFVAIPRDPSDAEAERLLAELVTMTRDAR